MKKIIRLTEYDITRIVKRVIQEQENEEDCSDLCVLFYDNKCLSLDQFETDVTKKIIAWYKEKYKNPFHRWFFMLKSSDPDVKELYNNSKIGESWTELDEMLFFYELALQYCDGKMEDYIERELEHPCDVSKPTPEKIKS